MNIKSRKYNIRIKSIMFGTLVLLLAVPAVPAANEVYLNPQTVYIPECGNATVQLLLNATDRVDTWSTMIGFDNKSVNITEVDFTGGITPTNASWGYHGDYVYLGGVSLDDRTGDRLVLANLTVECNGSCSPVSLSVMGEENVTRLIAGPPDDTPPHNGTIHAATWTDGGAQCVGCGDCGNVNGADGVDIFDAIRLYYNVTYYPDPSYVLDNPWAGNVNCVGGVDIFDAIRLYYNVTYNPDPSYALTCCGCT